MAQNKMIWVSPETHRKCKELAARITLLEGPITMRDVVERAFLLLEEQIDREEVQPERQPETP